MNINENTEGKPVLRGLASITNQVIYSVRPGIRASIVIDHTKKHDTQPSMVDIVSFGEDGYLSLTTGIRVGENHNLIQEIIKPTSKSVLTQTPCWNPEEYKYADDFIQIKVENKQSLKEFYGLLNSKFLIAVAHIKSFTVPNQTVCSQPDQLLDYDWNIEQIIDWNQMNLAYYNFFNRSGSVKILNNRLEAASTIPLFFVTQRHRNVKTAGLGHVVDLGYPVISTVAYRTGFKSSTISKYFKIKPWSGLDTIQIGAGMLKAQLQLADLMPENWVDSSVNVWNSIGSMAAYLDKVILTNKPTQEILAQSIVISGNKFATPEMVAITAPGFLHMNDCAREFIVGAVACLVKSAGNFPKKLLEEISGESEFARAERDYLTPFLLAGRSVRSAASISAKHLQHTLDEAARELANAVVNETVSIPGNDWSFAFSNKPFCLTSLPETVFTELLSYEALNREGDEMKHCVGSYGGSCRSGLAHVIGVHNQHTGDRSTLHVEFKRVQDRIEMIIVQHLSVKNSQPSVENIRAAHNLQKSLLNNTIVLNLPRINEMMDSRNKTYRYSGAAEILNNLLGEGWTKPEWKTEWWSKWQGFLGTTLSSPLEYLQALPDTIWSTSPLAEEIREEINRIKEMEIVRANAMEKRAYYKALKEQITVEDSNASFKP